MATVLLWDWLRRGPRAGVTGRDAWIRSELGERQARAALRALTEDGCVERYRMGSAERMGRYYYRLTESGLARASRLAGRR